MDATIKPSQAAPVHTHASQALCETARSALTHAHAYAAATAREDGHWCGELKSNVTITAQYVFLKQALQLDLESDGDALRRHLLSQQQADGSWSIAPGHRGDVSTSTEAYLALKILGQPPGSQPLCRARQYITSDAGGIRSVRVFTQIHLAHFGLWPWSAIPQLPAELILMPSWAPINIYRFSSWARSTIVPLLVASHHQPVFALPNGRSSDNEFLDELWVDAQQKGSPPSARVLEMASQKNWQGLAFAAVDGIIGMLGGLRTWNPLRRAALDACVAWVTSRQETAGDWAGIFPPMHGGVIALLLEGFHPHDPPVRRALAAIERFAWQDESGKRMQACVSPVWDTILMSAGLARAEVLLGDSGDGNAHLLRKRALQWVRRHQLLGPEGDWRVYQSRLAPGGFSFEYHNTWYPDLDDSAAAVIAFLKDDPQSVGSMEVLDACNWILGMQSRDGGWAAFDVNNDYTFLNKIPFSDMDSLCDPSTADIVGRVLEALGLFQQAANATEQHRSGRVRGLLHKAKYACELGIEWLAREQEKDGSWYGRWGVNYIYGTSNVLAGLAYFCYPDSMLDEKGEAFIADGTLASDTIAMARSAVCFLLRAQNADGGWGEALSSYDQQQCRNRSAQTAIAEGFRAVSTASQTSWALIGLLAYLPSEHPAIEAGIAWLVRNQDQTATDSAIPTTDSELTCCPESHSSNLKHSPTVSSDRGANVEAKTWCSRQYTGTGFPNHFYLGYTLYSHYFPMIALTEYLARRDLNDKLGKPLFNFDDVATSP